MCSIPLSHSVSSACHIFWGGMEAASSIQPAFTDTHSLAHSNTEWVPSIGRNNILYLLSPSLSLPLFPPFPHQRGLSWSSIIGLKSKRWKLDKNLAFKLCWRDSILQYLHFSNYWWVNIWFRLWLVILTGGLGACLVTWMHRCDSESPDKCKFFHPSLLMHPPHHPQSFFSCPKGRHCPSVTQSGHKHSFSWIDWWRIFLA